MPHPRLLPAAGGTGEAAADPPIAALYRQNFQFVWRYLRRLGVATRSLDDAVQDVFLVAHNKLGEFEHRSSYRGWLFGIATRVAYEHRRRDQRLTFDEQALAHATIDGEHSMHLRRQVLLLDELLSSLNDEQRAVFVMSEVEGFSAPEIAEALDVKLNTVYSRLRLGRSRFERALAKRRLLQLREVSP
jgi:RNA polymerase sigma-70 factor, ECF subfamily